MRETSGLSLARPIVNLGELTQQASNADINQCRQPMAAPELSIIIPTLNERDNLPFLIDRVRKALEGEDWEVIFVDDDSPDGTAALAKTIGSTDARIRCIHRLGRRGLAGACLEGLLASQATFVAVMDADMQHDELLLVRMLAVLRADAADLVVGSRQSPTTLDAGYGARRQQISRIAKRIARTILATEISDPMSGFFMLRWDSFEQLAPHLSSQGFKLLLDLVATAQGKLRIVELPFEFRRRYSGRSKLDERVILEFCGLILAKATNGLFSTRFIFFCLVGAIGILVHFVSLIVSLDGIGAPFLWSQVMATTMAIAANYVINNRLTYRDQRLVGRAFYSGLIRFYVISIIGAVSNVGVGNWLFGSQHKWWVAGLAGAIIGVIWNYLISSALVWHSRPSL